MLFGWEDELELSNMQFGSFSEVGGGGMFIAEAMLGINGAMVKELSPFRCDLDAWSGSWWWFRGGCAGPLEDEDGEFLAVVGIRERGRGGWSSTPALL